ncbi:MAG: DUF4249 domain-containing protein [Saprospiraceae bacterium]|jgi:hypothetical protein
MKTGFWKQLLWILLPLSVACNLEKEIEIELPDYAGQLALECYLEPGKPYRLTLTRSTAYFDLLPGKPDSVLAYLQGILVNGAQVNIRQGNKTIKLANRLAVDPESQHFYNYFSPELVPLDTVQPFYLDILTADGKTIQASARVPVRVAIDSVVVEFKEKDTLARALTYFTDRPGETNYYRRVLHRGNLNRIPEQDFSSDDRFVQDVFVFGTGYDFAEGDTLINTIYHLEEPYFRYLQSVQGAVSSNGNPFAQPSTILSNLKGTANAIGIFTGLQYDRVFTIVKR